MRVSKLSAHTGYLLRMVSNAVSHRFASTLAAEGVTVAEWAMLRVLYDSDAASPSCLSQSMGLTKGAISKLTDRLLAKGLVERTPDEEDRRKQSLSLSGVGRRKVPHLARIADANDAAFFAALSNEERGSLRGLLALLAQHHRLAAVPVD